ncbi:MAG: DHH family phosphoesterase [Microgenomates group bacterium]
MLDKRTAEKILDEIKKARRILLAVHVSPDLDGLSSVLAMKKVLGQLGKKTKIISFSQIPSRLKFVSGAETIEVEDFAKINFSEFDLFIALDCAQEKMITRSLFPENFPAGFRIVNIDHHASNTRFGDINLVVSAASTTEVLYQLFKIWRIKIDRQLAKLLFYGLIADSGCFQYFSTTKDTFRIGLDLLEKGASLNEVVLQTFRSYNFKTLKYWGKVLENMQIDKSGKFVWSKVSRSEREDLGVEASEVEGAANLFAPVILGTEFGIILTEETKDFVRGSLRSRNDFDVSKLAEEFGGGGHKAAAGFSLNMSLEEAEKKVLEVARKYIKR